MPITIMLSSLDCLQYLRVSYLLRVHCSSFTPTKRIYVCRMVERCCSGEENVPLVVWAVVCTRETSLIKSLPVYHRQHTYCINTAVQYSYYASSIVSPQVLLLLLCMFTGNRTARDYVVFFMRHRDNGSTVKGSY